jgi:ribonuclease HIII
MNFKYRKREEELDEKPKAKTLYTLKLTHEQMAKLKAALEKRLWFERAVPYSAFAYENNKVNVTVYKSGKLVVQGKATEEFVQNILEPEVTGEALMGYDEIHHPDWFELHAGCDEAGKGDVFGPLVTACVISGAETTRSLMKAGVRDSKKISDGEIMKLEKIIRGTQGVVVKSAQCSMEKYNELMGKPGANLNRLLSWLHSRALGDALSEKSVSAEGNAPRWGLLDQFSRRDNVDQYLARPDFELRRRTKAESDPVVAAASIIARAGFLRGMRNLSVEAGEKLMKGASQLAQAQFAKLREKFGAQEMRKYAKLHFKLKSII